MKEHIAREGNWKRFICKMFGHDWDYLHYSKNCDRCNRFKAFVPTKTEEFEGEIINARLYDKALTVKEVVEHYEDIEEIYEEEEE